MPDGSFLTVEPDFDALAALQQSGVEMPPDVPMPGLARRGRGAVGNPASRYDNQVGAAIDDGWSFLVGDEPALPPLPTTLEQDRSRSAIAWNDSPDIGFDRAVNPYRGCEHGCIYCYARPSHAYLGYSPGLDFETRLTFKPGVAALLEKELSKPGYTAKTLALGSNTDPYQPVERTMRLTRSVLEVLERFQHPVSIVTKSANVLADVDILQRLAKKQLVRVWVSITTLDPALARIMEPRASTTARRLQTVWALTQAGIPAAVLAAPMIPGLNDPELERILQAAKEAGAAHAGYVLLRLPLEIAELFEAWLHEHVPERARHVLALVRQTRAGALYDSRFGHRQRGSGPYADMLAARFARAARQHGMGERPTLASTHFAVPPAVGAQLSLL